ncbi:hypothetical protein Y1Q_0023453 [Alligator mississippiensis]|uniref:Uncharacterized protein n=1 Tax=Alligator mississippiensis TaxID=8496 RepID=A0A151NPK5_ALLMI|nr:hypothetical protein Y1Q_0023453 [Alligator mississippiensis]
MLCLGKKGWGHFKEEIGQAGSHTPESIVKDGPQQQRRPKGSAWGEGKTSAWSSKRRDPGELPGVNLE